MSWSLHVPLWKVVVAMVHGLVLAVHVVAGALGLLFGAVAMWQDTRRFAEGLRGGRAGEWYAWAVLVVCLSAVGLVVGYRHDLWWLAPVAALSYGLAALGRRAASHRFRGWSHAYVHGQGGSYIALVTALVVVALTVDGPVRGPAQAIPWVLPALIGTPLIEQWRRRITKHPTTSRSSTT